jgi:very-short-patch-repair endonuclease
MNLVTRLDEYSDVFRGSAARKSGLVTPAQLRGPRFRRLFQDVYVGAKVPVTHTLRCRGAALIVPGEAVLTGRSAATVRGVELARPHDPVEFVVPEEFRFGPLQGIHVRRTQIDKRESRPWNGIRIARHARIALDLLLRLSPRKRGWVRRLRIGVPDLDAFLRARHVRLKAIHRTFHGRRNRGIRLARCGLRLADPRAESLPESDLRIVMVYGGWNPAVQYNVRNNKRFLGRLDLALPESKVAVEYDGRWHRERRQHLLDKQRRKRLAAEGWRFVVVTAEMLAGDHQKVMDAIRAAEAKQNR